MQKNFHDFQRLVKKWVSGLKASLEMRLFVSGLSRKTFSEHTLDFRKYLQSNLVPGINVSFESFFTIKTSEKRILDP